MKQSPNISLQRLLRKTKDSYHSELDKIIGFYKTVLEFKTSGPLGLWPFSLCFVVSFAYSS